MRRVGIFTLFLFSMTLTSAACNRQGEEAARQPAAVADARGDGEEITVTGCLTAAPDRSAFVVTATRDALASSTVQATGGEAPTYTYELVGGADLHAHVGQQVAVKGRLDSDGKNEIDIDNERKTEQPETRAGNDTVTPAIETKEEIELQVRRLHVSSVMPTGNGACPVSR
jgi:hypothetical protein